MTPPRSVPNRDDYYMGLAYMIAAKSKDPSTQVGSIIVDIDNHPLGIGYNGPPRNINDNDIDWSRPAKYPYLLHSEINSINHSRGNLKGSTLYVTGHPCSLCMLDIVDKGISRICYGPLNITCVPKEEQELSLAIAKKGNVKVDKFEGSLNWIKDKFEWMNSIGLFDAK